MRQCNRWNLLIGNLSSGVGWGGGGSSNEEVVFRRLGGLLLSLPHGVKSSAIEEDQEGERCLSAGCNLSCRIRFKIIDPRGWRREMASRYFRSGAWFQLAMRKIKTPVVNELVSMKNFVEGLARVERKVEGFGTLEWCLEKISKWRKKNLLDLL